jgi:hypothetical protein
MWRCGQGGAETSARSGNGSAGRADLDDAGFRWVKAGGLDVEHDLTHGSLASALDMVLMSGPY